MVKNDIRDHKEVTTNIMEYYADPERFYERKRLEVQAMKLIGTKQKKKSQEESVGQIHVFSYKLLNEHIKFLYPKLDTLEKSIKQAMMPIPFEVYVSSMVFFSMIAGVLGGIMGFIASQFINIQPASMGLLLPILTGLMLFGMTFGILQTNSLHQS